MQTKALTKNKNIVQYVSREIPGGSKGSNKKKIHVRT